MSMVIVFLFPFDGMINDFEDRLSPESQILVRLYTEVALHPNTQLSLSMFTASRVNYKFIREIKHDQVTIMRYNVTKMFSIT